MTRNKQFIIDSIKMDLFRVVTATGDISKQIHAESARTFLNHAIKDFEKIPESERDSREREINNKLLILETKLAHLKDMHERLRWTEDVMTARCRL